MNIRRFLYTGGLVVGMAAAANASSFVVNCTPLTGSTELNGNVVCGQFQPSVGQTVTSISITVSGSETGTIKLINNDINNTDTSTGTTFGNFSLSSPLAGFSFGSPLFTTSFSTGPQTIGVAANISTPTSVVFGPFSSTVQSATSVDTSNFAPYLGAGSFNIGVNTLTFLALQGGNGNSGGTNTTSGTANAVVTYNYTTPSSTPEPTTMLLFGSGLVGLGLLRKRIKS